MTVMALCGHFFWQMPHLVQTDVSMLCCRYGLAEIAKAGQRWAQIVHPVHLSSIRYSTELLSNFADATITVPTEFALF